MNYQTAIAKLGNRNSRKVGNNTYLEKAGEAVAIRLHSTQILTFHPDGKAVVNTGGWKTVTTKARLNDYLPAGRISQERGQWYWTQNGARVGLFNDGDTVTANGEIVCTAKPEAGEAHKALSKRIASFAKLCGEKLPLNPPSGGCCWHCYMQTQDGASLGDAFGDVSHLESHMEEGYVVPSLVFRALKEAGAGQLFFHWTFTPTEKPADFARQTVARAVKKYLVRRFQKAGLL